MPSMESETPRAAKDVAPFLKQLRTMLNEEHPSILRWSDNGRAFEIVDMEQMMNHVLPKYFKHRKYTSFQRQLNYFNFRKWTKSKATVCTFSNDCFVRDQPELAWRITRKKSVHGAVLGKALASPPAARRAASSPRRAAPPTTTMAKHECEMPLDHEPAAFWGKHSPSVAISVPTIASCDDVYDQRASFPSPTDLDMMLKAHDYPLSSGVYYGQQQQQHQHQPTFHATASGPDPMESLEWIDALLPFVDRIDDEVYPFMYPSAANMLVTGMPPPASRSYDYVAL